MSKETIRVPDIGSSDPVDLIEVSVKKGDTIVAEDIIVVLESDKASLEVPAPLGGEVLNILVKAGDQVSEGDPLLELDVQDDEQAEPASDEDPTEPAPADESGKAATDEGDETERAGQGAVEGAASAGGGLRTVAVPDLGDIDKADVIEVSVAEGDTVEAEQTIIVLESEKASLEVPSPAAGTVRAVQVKAGDQVGAGDPVLELEVEGEADTEPGSEATAAGSEAATGPDGPAATDHSGTPGRGQAEQPERAVASGSSARRSRHEGRPSTSVHAGPAVRKLARETGVDLAQVTPSGPKGRVLKEDVHAYIKTGMGSPAAAGGSLPEIDFSEFGPVQRLERSKLRQVVAANLHRSWSTIPHVTQFDEADITELEVFRKSQNRQLEKEGVKLTLLAFLVKACAATLLEFPHFNSSLELGGEALIVKDYVHIGIAVDTPNGLMVPVLRDADRKGLKQIAVEIGELAERARTRKLAPGDMKGASFSISSLGGIGGTAFTPIVNWPEVAILGVSRSATKPVWDGAAFQPRLSLPLSLSYDHRVVDGADAARFTTFLSQMLGDLRRALL